MEEGEDHVGWWRRHGLTVFILLAAAFVSFLIRVLYSYQLIGQCNISYCFAGGSDSFYHARVMTYIIQNHANLRGDSMLNYPIGLSNPREPLFDWMNATLGILFAPFFGGDAVRAGMWFLEMQPPFWAAVGVIPVYLVGKEVSSRRMGLIAALIYPLLVGNIESTVATYANYLSFYAFFVFLALSIYIHAAKLAGTRRWVESYASPRSIWAGFKDFVRIERNSFNWSVLAGVAFGATMFAWQGYTYVVAIVVVFMVVVLLVERLRKVDPFGLYVVTLITGTIGFTMAMPYYYLQGEFGFWFTVPLLIFYGALLAMLPFLMLRDTPWVFSVGILVASLAGAAGALYLYSKSIFNAVITGQGYFVKNLIYSTVAEAQAPSFDSLIVSYGAVTFFIAFVGLGIFAFYLYKFKFRREHVFMVVLGVVGMYLPVTAAKFFLIGSPLFALFPAEVILFALDRMGYTEMRRTASTLTDSGGRWFALRRSLKARHFLIIIVAIGVLLPNVWYAVDAGIPYNEKSQYNTQIYNSLPPALQTSSSQSTSFYLGAAGIQTDTPSQYDENGYDWLSAQDANTIPTDRPAFISWWDYGFQAIEEGKHPSVADNFQDGIDPSGHFLLAQNETIAISVLTTDLLFAEQYKTKDAYLPGPLNVALKADGLNLTLLHTYMVNTSRDIPMVIANPGLYGPVNAGNLDSLNAMYYVVPTYIAGALSESGAVRVYQTAQSYTGWSIQYAMTDTRLFPTSGSNTGIFYAPVDLTDGVVAGGGIPTYYFTVTATGSDGNTYPLGSVPPGVQVVSSNINYRPAFYQSMIYHIFVGYNGTQAGIGSGIPGISSGLTNYQVAPGWMMQHFVMGYRTAYYCPYKNYTEHPGCFGAVNLDTAQHYQTTGTGTPDTSSSSYYSGGETILEYYPGLSISGSVELADGAPVPGVHVTVLDHWGTPHMVATTNSHGAYSIIAPPGNDTLVASYGAVGGLQQMGTQIATQNVTVSYDEAYVYGTPPVYVPIVLKPASLTGQLYWNVVGTGTYSPTSDVVIPDTTLTLSNGPAFNATSVTDLTGTFSFPNVPPGVYNLTVSIGTDRYHSLGTVTLTNGQSLTQDKGLKVSEIKGFVAGPTGSPLSGATVSIIAPASEARTTTTGPTGAYNFTLVSPGNYTLRASAAGGLVSSAQRAFIPTPGANGSANFSVTVPLIATLTATYYGYPMPNLPVRFSPLASTTNESEVVFTDPSGVVRADLAPGLWSVYALGALNGTYLSALENIDLVSGTAGVTTSLILGPVANVEGHVYNPSGTPQSGATLYLQSSPGAVMQATTNSTGAYHLLVPQGTYTLLADYSASSSAPSLAAITTVSVSGTITADLPLKSSVRFQSQIGYSLPSGTFLVLPAASALLTFNGVSLHLVADSNGTISVTLPQESGTFTLTASLYGFTQSAPLVFSSEQALVQATQIYLTPVPVTVSVPIDCSPSACGTPTLNFTAASTSGASTSAQAVTQNGTLLVTASLTPGAYSITGYSLYSGAVWGTVGNVILKVTAGSQPVSLATIRLYQERAYYGSLHLPNGTVAPFLAGTTVELVNALGNFTLNGSAFTSSTEPFRAPPGTYTLWAVVQNGSASYAYLGNVTLNATSGPLPALTLTPASSLDLKLSTALGTGLHATLNVTVIDTSQGTNLARLTFPMDLSGTLSTVLPNGTYEIEVNQTVLLNLSGLLYYETLSTTSACVHTPTSGGCTVSLTSTSAVTRVSGKTLVGGNALIADGTILAIPDANNTSRATVTAPIVSGAYSITLFPGKYVFYAVSGSGGVPEVNLSSVAIPYSATGVPLNLGMSSGWTVSLQLVPPAGVSILSSRATLNVTLNRTSETFSLSAVPLNSTYNFVLPSDTWLLRARASGTAYGKTVSLASNATLSLYDSNTALTLDLAPQWVRTVSMTVEGSTSQSVSEGGNASFSFVVNDTGNALVHMKFKGSPQTWGFIFTPANATLTPTLGSNTLNVEVQVTVPKGTLVTQGTATLETLLFGTTNLLSTTSVSLVVDPIHAINITANPSTYVIGNHTLSLGFGAKATGNSVEIVTVSVENGALLNQSGWSYTISQVFSSLTPGNPSTQGTLTLSAVIPGATMPPVVIILAVDHSDPAASKTLTISAPHGELSIPGPLVTTGPNIGSEQPAYISPLILAAVFIPAAAILTFTFVRRWWKRRRWVRT